MKFGVCLLGFWLLGCDDPLKAVELVQEPRVLGARVEVVGDVPRAAPAPGESAKVTFLLASPALDQTLGFQLGACPAAARRSARTACAGDVFASAIAADGEQPAASLEFTVPADLEPAGRVAVLGILCPSGSPKAEGLGCAGREPGIEVSLELELAHASDVNSSPTLEADSLSFDGAPWPDLPALPGDCSGQGYAQVTAGSEHEFEVRLDEIDRDPLTRQRDLEPLRESLQLSHFATAGDLSRAFQSIAWDSDELTRRASWKAPEETGLVRVWLVLRDLRGGSDFVERDVCVQ